MPLFEYRCKKCGHVTTFLEKMSGDSNEHKCEKCQSENTEKIFSKVSQKKENDKCTTGTCPFS